MTERVVRGDRGWDFGTRRCRLPRVSTEVDTNPAIDARETVLRAAVGEAARRGDPCLGTDHLPLGLLADPVGIAAEALQVDLDEARGALLRLDGQALGAIGVDPGLAVSGSSGSTRRGRRPFTEGAKQVLVRAVREASGSAERRITDRHLMLGIVTAGPPDPAVLLLRALDRDPAAIRESLRSIDDGRR